jgi:Fe2+ transport system protein FeoA
MPLALARPGEKCVIREVRAGKMARAKLTALGIQVGDQVEIISGDGHGRLVLAHHFTRLAMGRGLAVKIMVSPDQGNEQLNQ